LTYSSLQSALSLDSPQALESLITIAIYSNIVTGTIDPAHQVINITSVAPLRDLAPGSIPALAAALTQWSQQCTNMLAQLDDEVSKIKRNAQKRGEQRNRVQLLVDERIAQAEDTEKSRPKRGALDLKDDNGDEMEVDSGALGDGRTRTGRVSKRLGIGRNG
jgi:COP9 signalosome complex subunit 7